MYTIFDFPPEYINIKRKSKVDHCGNEIGVTSITLITYVDQKDGLLHTLYTCNAGTQ